VREAATIWPRPLQVELWPFEPWKWCPSHVWRGPPLCQFQASLLSTYARCARQTNVRHTSSLNTPYPRGGGIIMDEQNYYQMLLPHLSLSSYSIFFYHALVNEDVQNVHCRLRELLRSELTYLLSIFTVGLVVRPTTRSWSRIVVVINAQSTTASKHTFMDTVVIFGCLQSFSSRRSDARYSWLSVRYKSYYWMTDWSSEHHKTIAVCVLSQQYNLQD